MPSKPGEPSIGIKPAIAPIPCKLLRQLGMQCKAAPRQRCQRQALAPIAREKPTGFSGGGASNAGAFENNGLHATAAQEIGDRSPDHPAPADQHIHGFKRSLATSRPQFSSGHAIGNSLLSRSNDSSPPCLQVADPSLYCCAAEARRLHRASPRRARPPTELKFRIQFPPAESPPTHQLRWRFSGLNG